MDIVLPPSNCSHLWCHFLFDKYTLSIENITNSFQIKFKIRMSLCRCAAPGEHPHHFRVFPDHVITWPPRKVWTLVNDCSCPYLIFLFFFSPHRCQTNDRRLEVTEAHPRLFSPVVNRQIFVKLLHLTHSWHWSRKITDHNKRPCRVIRTFRRKS